MRRSTIDRFAAPPHESALPWRSAVSTNERRPFPHAGGHPDAEQRVLRGRLDRGRCTCRRHRANRPVSAPTARAAATSSRACCLPSNLSGDKAAVSLPSSSTSSPRTAFIRCPRFDPPKVSHWRERLPLVREHFLRYPLSAFADEYAFTPRYEKSAEAFQPYAEESP